MSSKNTVEASVPSACIKNNVSESFTNAVVGAVKFSMYLGVLLNLISSRCPFVGYLVPLNQSPILVKLVNPLSAVIVPEKLY